MEMPFKIDNMDLIAMTIIGYSYITKYQSYPSIVMGFFTSVLVTKHPSAV